MHVDHDHSAGSWLPARQRVGERVVLPQVHHQGRHPGRGRPGRFGAVSAQQRQVVPADGHRQRQHRDERPRERRVPDGGGAARPAPDQGDAIVRAVAVRSVSQLGQQACHLLVGVRHRVASSWEPVVPSGTSAARSATRPLLVWLFTPPTEIPITAAVSASLRSQ